MTPLRICTFHPRSRGARVLFQSNNGAAMRRSYAMEKNNPAKLPQAPQGQTGPNTNQEDHISVEAAKMAEIQGKEGPDLEQGTPVEEIFKDEKDIQQQAPEALKQQVQGNKATNLPSGTRSFSTTSITPPKGTRTLSTSVRQHQFSSPVRTRSFSISTRRRQLDQHTTSPQPMDAILASNNATPTNPSPATLKFPLPEPSTITPKSARQEAIITQLTNLLMKDGKKSVAERNMSVILSTLRTSPAPTFSPTRPLLPGHPPATHLPLNPVLYLTLAVDSAAPLFRMRSQKGAAGGGVALQIPVPLGLRQRRRQAWVWIVDAASKRQNRGSGRDTFAVRVAQEVVSVVEGKSGVWEKRHAVHRLATAARTNVGFGQRPGFRR